MTHASFVVQFVVDGEHAQQRSPRNQPPKAPFQKLLLHAVFDFGIGAGETDSIQPNLTARVWSGTVVGVLRQIETSHKSIRACVRRGHRDASTLIIIIVASDVTIQLARPGRAVRTAAAHRWCRWSPDIHRGSVVNSVHAGCIELGSANGSVVGKLVLVSDYWSRTVVSERDSTMSFKGCIVIEQCRYQAHVSIYI